MNQPIEFPQRRKPTAFSSVLSLVALTVCLLWPTSARAEKLFLSFPDAIGEQSSFLPGNPPPKIDVAEMSLTFETTTGEYSIVVRTTVAAPFVNLRRDDPIVCRTVN